tara:strand:- start:206 stop:535 length:330 start_codon:yes stop_codon:yes gene_type:complete
LIKKLLLFIIIFHIQFASATEILIPNNTILRPLAQVKKSVIFKNETIYLKGFIGPGTIEVYSIIGNKITELVSQELIDFQFTHPFKSGNMYIIRVVTQNDVSTFKIVTP